MKISDVMTPECTFCNSNDTIADAAKLMATQDIGFVPIAENDRLVGTLTDRDIVVRGIANGNGRPDTPVRELMSDHVYYCYDDQDCADVAANMADMKVRRFPVVNREKRLIGTVSLGDLAYRDQEEEVAGDALADIARH